MKAARVVTLFVFSLTCMPASLAESKPKRDFGNQYKMSIIRPGHDFTKIPPGAEYKPGELIVRFAPKQGLTRRTHQEKLQVINGLGGTLVKEYDIVADLVLQRYELPEIAVLILKS